MLGLQVGLLDMAQKSPYPLGIIQSSRRQSPCLLSVSLTHDLNVYKDSIVKVGALIALPLFFVLFCLFFFSETGFSVIELTLYARLALNQRDHLPLPAE